MLYVRTYTKSLYKHLVMYACLINPTVNVFLHLFRPKTKIGYAKPVR
jgi:hypothetical protein